MKNLIAEQDLVGHFWFDKALIADQQWKYAPSATKSIYPVILTYRNGLDGTAFPSRATIAAKSGVTEKTAQLGIDGLKDSIPNVSIQHYITTRGRWSKRFHIKQPSIGNGESFPFHRCIVESGAWANLTPTARSLYPVLRHFGTFDINLYSDIECVELDSVSLGEFYKVRKWDMCMAESDVLAMYAGIGKRSLFRALDSLVRNGMVDSGYSDGLLVRLRPS